MSSIFPKTPLKVSGSMTDPGALHPASPMRINFTWKIIFIAITLLAASQVLGTLISVSTFETLLLKTLTTKYEILGNDLKRKIEHALKFGKRLDQFIGMDKLIAPVYHQTEDIDEIFLFDQKGTLFFSSKRTSSQQRSGDATQKNQPDNTFLVDSTRKQINLPVQTIARLTETEQRTVVHDRRYYVLFPITPALGSRPGVLALSFHQSILDHQKHMLMKSAGKKLLLSLAVTAFILGSVIHLFFTRPSRRQAEQLIRHIQTRTFDSNNGQQTEGCSLFQVYDPIAAFLAETQEAEKTLGHTLRELHKLIPDRPVLDSIHQMQLVLKGTLDETD